MIFVVVSYITAVIHCSIVLFMKFNCWIGWNRLIIDSGGANEVFVVMVRPLAISHHRKSTHAQYSRNTKARVITESEFESKY
jgi:hypothetical protein